MKNIVFRAVKSEKTSVKTLEEFANAPNLVISSNYLPISDMLVESPHVVAAQYLFLKHYLHKLHCKKSTEKVLSFSSSLIIDSLISHNIKEMIRIHPRITRNHAGTVPLHSVSY